MSLQVFAGLLASLLLLTGCASPQLRQDEPPSHPLMNGKPIRSMRAASLYFGSTGEGWASLHGGLFHIKSGAGNWEKVDSAQIPQHLLFTDAGIGFGVVERQNQNHLHRYNLLRSGDGGRSWVEVRSFDAPITSLVLSDTKHIALRTRYGGIDTSDTSAKEWTNFEMQPIGDDLQGIHENLNVLATDGVQIRWGYDHGLWYTADSGKQWRLVSTDDVSDIQLFDNGEGYAVDHGAQLLRLASDGHVAERSTIGGTNATFARVTFATDELGFVVLNTLTDSSLYRTMDGGRTWNLAHHFATPISEIEARDEHSVFVITQDDELLLFSSDSGDSWVPAMKPSTEDHKI